MRLAERVVSRIGSLTAEWAEVQVVEVYFGRVVAGYMVVVGWRALRAGLEEDRRSVVVFLGAVDVVYGRRGFARPVARIYQHTGEEWSLAQQRSRCTCSGSAWLPS